MNVSSTGYTGRIKVYDITKLFAIFLVIWGHTILHLQNYEYDIWDNSLYRWIYSFHMPLFMMISGFFSAKVGPSFKEYFIKKSRQLIVPSLSFGIIFTLSWHFVSKGCSLSTYIFCYWFLKSAFICALLYYVAIKFPNKKLGFIITLFISVFCYFYLVNLMYFPFLVGVFLSNNKKLLKALSLQILIISGIIYILLFAKWDYTMASEPLLKLYRYISPYTWEKLEFPLLCYLYRVIMGICGSLFIISLFIYISKHIPENRIGNHLASWGSLTLGIYLWQAVLLEHLMMKLINLSALDRLMFNYVVSPIISIGILLICIWLTQLLKSYKWTNRIFLGAK